MTLPSSQEELVMVTAERELEHVAERAASASLLALDVEGNGLFAYRPRLCTVQLAWVEDGALQIALVDALRTRPTALSRALGPSGPPKVLHDFTFDVKLLADEGIAAGNLRDTSVLARMLGRKATGLASLLASELGIVVSKELQQHDWSRRPLQPNEIEYLAGDVRHLLALYEKLGRDAAAADILPEVETECAFKHASALAPPRERRPAYLRIKGADAQSEVGLAVLRRLVEEREIIASEWDVPPFKVAGNDVLLTLAETRPQSVGELRKIRRGISPRLLGAGQRIVAAVLAGLSDGTIPPADRASPPRLDKAIAALRRAREKRLTAWRRKVAAERGVDEQVVLPGHCLQDLLEFDGSDLERVAAVAGIGRRRFERDGATLARLLAEPMPETAPEPVSEPQA